MCKIVVFYLQLLFQVFLNGWSAKGKIMLNSKMYVAVVNCLDKFFSELKLILTSCLVFLLLLSFQKIFTFNRNLCSFTMS